jgi:hypothetical protein
MAGIATYDYQFHGGANGYSGRRAILRLYDANRSTVAYVHFIPAGLPIPNDVDGPPWATMFMPEQALPAVIDMLRNEKPISFYFASGSGFLHTGDEPVGESEISGP